MKRGTSNRLGKLWPVVLAALAGCGSSSSIPQSVAIASGAITEASMTTEAPITETPTAAQCGAGSLPEGAIQGEVPLADRQSGRNLQGYRCNLKLIGQYQGQGASWVNPSFAHCSYMATSDLGRPNNPSPGVQVIDVSNPVAPVLSTTLTSPAMLMGPWESLKVNPTRHLLGAVPGGLLISGGYFDVYDISDCAHPRHLNVSSNGMEAPESLLGHEGNWSPDGLTYWSAGLVAGSLTAVDVSNPKKPKVLYSGSAGGPLNHGLAISHDGTRLYLSSLLPAGVLIYDVSDIQNRVPTPMITQISQVTWADLGGTQHVIPVTYAGRPYLIVPSELGEQGIRGRLMFREVIPTRLGDVVLLASAIDLDHCVANLFEIGQCGINHAGARDIEAFGTFVQGFNDFVAMAGQSLE